MPPVHIPMVEWEDAWLVAVKRTPRDLGSSPSWNLREARSNLLITNILIEIKINRLGEYAHWGN